MTGTRKVGVAVILAAVMSLFGAAVAANLEADRITYAPDLPEQVRAETRPLTETKDPIKTVSKVVGKAVTTVRQVPQIVERPPQVAPGQIRPCTQGEFVVDIATIAENAFNQLLGAFGGATEQTPVGDVLGFTLPSIYQLIGATNETTDETSTTTEDVLRSFIRSHLISVLFDEAEQCPEFVEGVVTTAITELRPEPKETTSP